QNIQPRATNLGLWHGLQVRSPFCDFPLTEWTFELPGSLFLQGSCEKYLLKRAVEDWLPPEIVWREKRGMGVPLTEWYLTKLRSLLGDYLSPRQLRDRGFFRPDLPVNAILGKLGGQIRSRRTGEILWLLLMWEAWRAHILGETVRVNFFLNPLRLPSWVWQLRMWNERRNSS
ncbi:MAG: asparagine synthase-related protein, partial [Cyanobacteriota bacterium]|nr:asparagine synthase-related protein [Cyanobacteriota bacterium]